MTNGPLFVNEPDSYENSSDRAVILSASNGRQARLGFAQMKLTVHGISIRCEERVDQKSMLMGEANDDYAT
jgi:hypothetical protein